MSLINWLFKRQNIKPVGNASAEAAGGADSKPSSTRRTERVERREQLYAVVRHAMASAGVLTSSYKFKVLSLDSRAGSFLVMMDMVNEAAESSERMSEIEALIANNAKNRFDIIVAAVYWRLSDYVAAGLSHRAAVPAKAVSAAPMAASVASAAAAPAVFKRPEPVSVDEVLAFKNAFATQTQGATLFASGEVQKTGKRSTLPMAPSDLGDGHGDDDRVTPLGPTQYGELN